MATNRRLWCQCGASIAARSHPPRLALDIVEVFRTVHQDLGHAEQTDNPQVGSRWRRSARLRERRAVARAQS